MLKALYQGLKQLLKIEWKKFWYWINPEPINFHFSVNGATPFTLKMLDEACVWYQWDKAFETIDGAAIAESPDDFNDFMESLFSTMTKNSPSTITVSFLTHRGYGREVYKTTIFTLNPSPDGVKVSTTEAITIRQNP